MFEGNLKEKQAEAQQFKRTSGYTQMLEDINNKRVHRHTHKDILYSQDRLTDAIKEAKSINYLLEQQKLKMRTIKVKLEDKTLPKFQSLETLMKNRENSMVNQGLAEEVEGNDEAVKVKLSLGDNKQMLMNQVFAKQAKEMMRANLFSGIQSSNEAGISTP